MERYPAVQQITRESSVDFLSAVDRGMYEGVQRALAGHKRAGRAIVVERDGKIVEIPPGEIVVDDAFTDSPMRDAR